MRSLIAVLLIACNSQYIPRTPGRVAVTIQGGQQVYVRDGRVRGQRGWVVDKVEDLSTGELVEHFLSQVYRDDPGAQQESEDQLDLTGPVPKAGRASADWRAVARRQAVPREVLVPELPPDTEAIQEWLSSLRGGRVTALGGVKVLSG